MIPASLSGEFDTVIVLDTETTGLNARNDRIIELAAARMRKDTPGEAPDEEIDLFLRLPEGESIPPEIVTLTGITDEILLREGVPEEEAARRFAELFPGERTLVVAYNAQFDLCFLYYFLLRHGRAGLLRGVRFLDALTVYRDRRSYPHKLANAVETYDLHTQNTHRAIDDTLATFELLGKMAEEKDDLAQYVNLFGYSKKYGISGQRISSVTYKPQGYDLLRPLYEI